MLLRVCRVVKFQYAGQHLRLSIDASSPLVVMYGALEFFSGRSCLTLSTLTMTGITKR